MTKRAAIAIALNTGWRGFLGDMSTTTLLCPSMSRDLNMLCIFRASKDKIHYVKVDMSECIGRRCPMTVASGDGGQDEAGKYKKGDPRRHRCTGQFRQAAPAPADTGYRPPQIKSHDGHGRQAAQDLQRVVPVPFHVMASLRARMLLSWAVR
ncbi:hypothetical protein [Stenotrophomonas sp. YAU14D1_LEIMI4_1]|uniref:hypothetical protein n=1 Tax=Stenotrophomonas sp. YAU14D1_LEIMI4_1 TaxID=2072407 RepID=UPI00131F3BAB|nr:hypothetical protein [Stenotrophomonas sp. YAU14D1_LEIMI4_1]